MNRIFELAIEDVNDSQDICEDTIAELIVKIKESTSKLENVCKEIDNRLNKNENS